MQQKCTLGSSSPPAELIQYCVTAINNDTQEITISFTVPEKDCMYKDFIRLSVDNPAILLSAWKTNRSPITQYDSLFKETKQIFTKDFTVSVTATFKKPITDLIHIFCSYYRRSEKKINQIIITLVCTQTEIDTEKTDTLLTTMPHVTTEKKIFPSHSSPIDDYCFTALCIIHTAVASFRTDHKKYFSFLMLLIMLLIACAYFFRKQLQKYKQINELLEICISLLMIVSVMYCIMRLHTISTPLITTSITTICALITGLFYIKKSTSLQSGYLRTFCTLVGTVCICITLFLLFKIVRYADEQFDLL